MPWCFKGKDTYPILSSKPTGLVIRNGELYHRKYYNDDTSVATYELHKLPLRLEVRDGKYNHLKNGMMTVTMFNSTGERKFFANPQSLFFVNRSFLS